MLAVDIGSYAVKIGVVNMHGKIIKDEFIIKKGNQGALLITPEVILDKLKKYIDEFGKNRFAGVGISITGLVNNENKFIEFSLLTSPVILIPTPAKVRILSISIITYTAIKIILLF